MSLTYLANTIRRSQWDAENPAVVDFSLKFPVKIVYVTFTDTERCKTKEDCKIVMKALQSRNKLLGLPDIADNFMIAQDGYCYVGRGWVANPELPEELKPQLGSVLRISYVGRKGSAVDPVQREIFNDLIKLGKVNEFVWDNTVIKEDL